MSALRITLTVTIPLPKRDIPAAAELGMKAATAAYVAEDQFKDLGGRTLIVTDITDDESPAPTPLPVGGRRKRSAQPAEPQAAYDPGPSVPTTRAPEARAPGPDPTVDGLAPEPGADPGPVPAFLVREPAP